MVKKWLFTLRCGHYKGSQVEKKLGETYYCSDCGFHAEIVARHKNEEPPEDKIEDDAF